MLRPIICIQILSSAQEEEKEGNEEGEGRKLEWPDGSEQEKTTDGYAEISERGKGRIDYRDEEEAADSERGTEAESDQEDEDDGEEEEAVDSERGTEAESDQEDEDDREEEASCKAHLLK